MYIIIHPRSLQAYSKEYGKKIQGKVDIMSLTGAPYTVVNKVVLMWVWLITRYLVAGT